MSKQKGRSPFVVFLLLIVVAGGAGVWAWKAGYLFASAESHEIAGAEVRRGPLEITVTERGNLTSENSVSVKSEVEGRATLLYLIPEGTHVEPGDLIAEIDTSQHVDQRVAQEISVQSARATETKAREALEIQRIENESQIAKAEQDVSFARLELEKYIGFEVEGIEKLDFKEILVYLEKRRPTDAEVENTFSGGNRQQELQEFRDDILIREEELKRAEDRLAWSRQLAEKGFVERTELEADELAFTRSGIMLEQAERAFFLLEKYEHPKEWTRLQNQFAEAQRQLLKANKQAVAQIADFEAAKAASIVKLQLEEEKLARTLGQITKGKIYSPITGMVVYAREEGRRGDSTPMQEGGEVRERQEIVNIPGEGGMVAEASIHESSLKQVSVGLPVVVTVDALPGREFRGKVGRVALLPDKNSWWANPNLRLYKTEILVDNVNADMRPGMSCSIEILVERIPDTLYVPVQSVHHSGGKAVAWVSKAGKVEQREVQAGSHNDKWLAIKGGLSEGEVVLLSPPVGFQPEASPDQLKRSEGFPEGTDGDVATNPVERANWSGGEDFSGGSKATGSEGAEGAPAGDFEGETKSGGAPGGAEAGEGKPGSGARGPGGREAGAGAGTEGARKGGANRGRKE